jgi:hypothetical protein
MKQHLHTSGLSLIILLALMVDFSLQAQSTTHGYAKQYGSTLSDQLQSLAADPFGNLVIGGSFSDSSDMDPGSGTFMIYGNGHLVPDGFLAKLDSAGNPRWACTIGGQAYDDVLGVTTDAFGNVFACGYFRDTVDFDPGPGVFHLISTKNHLGFFQEDGFVVKYDSIGNFRWAIQVAGPRVQQCTTLVADALGNIYVTGDFTDTLDLDPGPAVDQRIATGTATDLFLIKLDSSGNYLWGFTLGDFYADRGASVAVNAAGEVILGGTFGVNVDFNPGSGVDTLNAGFSEDGFLAKYSSTGNFLWAKHIKSITGGSNVEHLTVDPSGNIYATGLFSRTNQFNPNNPADTLVSKGIYDAYIMKYTSAGQYIWAKAFGGTADDRFHATAVSGHSKLFTTGMLSATIDFDPGPGVSNLTSLGLGDAYLLELDSAGNFVSAGQMGSTMNDTGRDIVVDANGRVIVGGFFMGTGDFNPSPGVFNMTSAGSQDVFLTIHWQNIVITQTQAVEATAQHLAYPNPSKGQLHISGLQAGIDYTYECLDMQGRVIQSGKITQENNSLEVTGSEGIYFLRLTAPYGISIHKILKGNE